MSMKKVYMIECEWDMGFSEAFATREAAMKEIEEADWDSVEEGFTYQEAFEEGFLHIKEITVTQ